VALDGSGFVERVNHTDAFERLLLNAVDHYRVRQPGDFQHCRGDIDHVMEAIRNSVVMNTSILFRFAISL
jgi:hypothetical protein